MTKRRKYSERKYVDRKLNDSEWSILCRRNITKTRLFLTRMQKGIQLTLKHGRFEVRNRFITVYFDCFVVTWLDRETQWRSMKIRMMMFISGSVSNFFHETWIDSLMFCSCCLTIFNMRGYFETTDLPSFSESILITMTVFTTWISNEGLELFSIRTGWSWLMMRLSLQIILWLLLTVNNNNIKSGQQKNQEIMTEKLSLVPKRIHHVHHEIVVEATITLKGWLEYIHVTIVLILSSQASDIACFTLTAMTSTMNETTRQKQGDCFH